jgi:hypothetical protein
MFGLDRLVGRRIAGRFLDDAEVDELVDAVVDVLPHATERLHDRFGGERFAGPRGQEAQNAGAQG